MRIAVNTRLLLPNKLEGIGWFAHETLSRITTAHPEHDFIFLFDRPFDKQFVYAPNVMPVVIFPPTRHPLLYKLWFDHLVPAALRKHRADLFVSPDGMLSLRTTVPQLPVIHDLNFEHHPEDLPKAYRTYYRDRFPRFAKKAARIVTVSHFSKADIVERYGIAAGKIDVVHNGVSTIFTPLSPAEKEASLHQLTGGAPYFICVGALHPRKNIARLLEAFDRFAAQDGGTRLVIVGEAFWWDRRMKSAWEKMQHKDRVVFTGRLGQADLRKAMGAALALAYVSYFEGFGIPVVEAMRCGVPVLAARATSLPEVAGDAAVYCDPFNVDDMVAGLQQLATDAALRERLAAVGLERAARFTWQATADGLWHSIAKTLDGAA